MEGTQTSYDDAAIETDVTGLGINFGKMVSHLE